MCRNDPLRSDSTSGFVFFNYLSVAFTVCVCSVVYPLLLPGTVLIHIKVFVIRHRNM